MSPTILIALLFILKSGTHVALNVLNLRDASRTDRPLPEVLRASIDNETVSKARAYTQAKIRFGLITELFDLAIMLLVLACGFLGILESWSRAQAAQHPWLQGLLLFGALSLLSGMVQLPFDYYRNFVLEERFGFNKLTVKQWIKDLCIQTLVSLILMTPLLLGLFAIIVYFSSTWWLLGWALLFGFQVLVIFIYPRFLAPLFNAFTPLEDGLLKTLLGDLAKRLRFPFKDIFVMDGSKRSAHANAYFAGFGTERRIVLYDTLLKQLEPAEIEAVLAHEIGHYHHKHVLRMLALAGGLSLYGFFLMKQVGASAWLYQAFSVTHATPATMLLCFSLVAGPVLFFITPFFSSLSRAHEFQADAFAANAVQGSAPLISGLLKLSKHSLGNLFPHPWYSFVYYSHPPMVERIRALDSFVASADTQVP